jgi:fatty-acid peroxygenase
MACRDLAEPRFPACASGHGATMQTIGRDLTLALFREGYALLPNRRRQLGADVFGLRLLGRPAVALCGVEATQRFYDEDLFVRAGALPEPVRHTLTGDRTVHAMDGAAHRRRKEMFLALREPTQVRALLQEVEAEWEQAAARWAQQPQVALFDAAAQVILRATASWAGVPLAESHSPTAARDMVSMVDGFGSPGPRHARGRLARRRAERRLESVVLRMRVGRDSPPAGSMFERVLHHRDEDGELLDARLVAVEMLNVLRPTVAVAWFLAFSAHAMHRWPENRRRLREDDAWALAFAHEVRRFYPFAPFMGARTRRDVRWDDDEVAEGTLVLLDLFGQNHHPALWKEPYAFAPQRFLDQAPGMFDLVPQGGGDPATGHRCPGEDITVQVLKTLAPRLARLEYDVPDQDLSIPLARIPTRPRSGVVLGNVRAGG